MNPQENANAVKAARLAVESHCMCARFEDLGGAYRVLYPDGFRLDGVQAVYQTCGKRLALDRILSAMERHWQSDQI